MFPKAKLAAALLLLALTLSGYVKAQPWLKHGDLRVHSSGRFIEHEDGTPFFWLADTPWGIFRNSYRDSRRPDQPPPVETYFSTRSAQGFNVIQVQLLPLPGARENTITPGIDTQVNAYGYRAFADNADGYLGDFSAPLTEIPAPAGEFNYWEYVDVVLDKAQTHGLYVAVAPAWSAHLNPQNPIITNRSNAAYDYGQFLGKRFGNRPNIIWLMGGDYDADNKKRRGTMYAAMAEGITDAVNGDNNSDERAEWHTTLMSYHPKCCGSLKAGFYQDEPWLDFVMVQTGARHTNKQATYNSISAIYSSPRSKPVLDGEVAYEYSTEFVDVNCGETVDRNNPRETRSAAYYGIFAGSFGHTYGHRNIIHFLQAGQASRFGGCGPWFNSLGLNNAVGAEAGEAAADMLHLKRLMTSRPFYSRRPFQYIIRNSSTGSVRGADRLQATRASDGSYAFIYSTNSRPITADLSAISGSTATAWWYDPRTGTAARIGSFPTSGNKSFSPPGSSGSEEDWILVLDDASKQFCPPGQDGDCVRGDDASDSKTVARAER